VPVDLPQAIEWRFDEPQPDWKVVTPHYQTVAPAEVSYTDDALRVTLNLAGGIYVDLPELNRRDWTEVVIRARSEDDFSESYVNAGFNLTEGSRSITSDAWPFEGGTWKRAVYDGSVQTYRLPVDDRGWNLGRPWKQLGIWFGSREEVGSIDILSVSLVPRDAVYLSTLKPLWGDELVSKIDSLAEAALTEGLGVGLSIGVKRGDDLLLAKGYGLADIENAVPATAETVYRIGSLTKQFTAAAIMQLVERGEIGLDDPVTKFLPYLSTQGHEVTIRHLLTQTSGIWDPSYTGDLPGNERMARHWTATLLSNEESVAQLQDEPFYFAPGEQDKYSNTGFRLLGLVIEEVSGESYGEYLDGHIFGPLGLTGSSDCDTWSIIPGRARGYSFRGGVVENAPLVYNRGAHGCLCSTVLDLLSWSSALRGGRVVSTDGYRQMTTPATLNNGATTEYGFGLCLGGRGWHQVVYHGGLFLGFTASLVHLTDVDVDIVVLSNIESRGADRLGTIIGRWVLGWPLPKRLLGG